MNCLSHFSPPRSKVLRMKQWETPCSLPVADLVEVGAASFHMVWRSAAQLTIPLTLSSCNSHQARRALGPDSAMILTDLATSGGRGISFGKKKSALIALRRWPSMDDAPMMCIAIPFLCSPAHVYRMGRKEPMRRSSLKDVGLSGDVRPFTENIGIVASFIRDRADASSPVDFPLANVRRVGILFL